MSKASREWKEMCKRDNRLTKGTSWPRKDMSLASYKVIKRYVRKQNSRKNLGRIIVSLKELDEGKGIKFNPFEEE